MLTDTFEVLDKRFGKLVMGNVHREILHSGTRWAEGPAYFPAGKYLIWSDIPNDRLMRWDETDGSVSEFLKPSRNQNGHTVDREGRLISCEHRGRQVSRVEHDGSLTVLASHYEGKRLNSPTTSWSNPTARSGSPIRATASTANTRATSRQARWTASATSIASTATLAR